ncbi:MAG: hypothetical protein ACU84Q_08870 [Gammaproteobacteria bacterium]
MCIASQNLSIDFVLMRPGLLAVWLLVLIGCGINTRDETGAPVRMTKDEFAAYVETVFRHHNGVVNELILATSLSDDPEMELPAALISAERVMAATCHPLNEMVSAKIEGRELSAWSKLLLIDQVPTCAESSRRVAALVEQTF